MDNQSTNNGLDSFDHVVVLMLENRSFDNLLGYLYTEDEIPPGKQFEGLNRFHDALPVPPWAKDHEQHPSIAPYAAKNYHQPFPDPGEVYQHVNTQIFNYIDPDNCGVSAAKMVPPYNIPQQPPAKLMQGFIKDYVNTLNALTGKHGKHFNDPDFDMYSVIMQCFKPTQVNVLTTLAKQFAVFDHWHCSVPSQTWCNRAFWHAATSGGKVVNPTDCGGIWQDIKAMVSWVKHVWSQPTLFDRLNDNNISHAVYIEDLFSLTELVNGFKHDNIIKNGTQLQAFKDDLNNGNLPQYAFLEPKFIGQHNDQHPSSADAGLLDDDGPTHAGTVLLGEQLIWDVYTTIFTSQYKDNTLLIITHDEHGGCFDHVVPPTLPKELWQPGGQKGFNFDRLGVRVPMVMVSAYLQPNTIINETFEHSSFIKTMCEKWNLDSLTPRDQFARSFADIFSSTKRDHFPPIKEPVIPAESDQDYAADELNDLQKSILLGAHYLCQAKQGKHTLSDLPQEIHTVGQAITHLQSLKHELKDLL